MSRYQTNCCIQIWFQNRRQNDRRRSRPLEAHEIVPHLRSTTQVNETDSEYRIIKPAPKTENEKSGQDAGQGSQAGTPSSVPEPARPGNTVESKDSEKPIKTIQHGKKRSYSDMKARPTVEVCKVDAIPAPSVIRLSMTTEGVMQVKTSLEDTPSPAKERPAAPEVIRRASGGTEKGQVDADVFAKSDKVKSSPSFVSKGLFGRSRDTRTWEFYCDSNARDSLSKHAEAESKGSATSAIALMRSSSQKSRQRPLSRHLSATNTKLAPPHNASSKPKLIRAKSSMARLGDASSDFYEKPKKGGSITVFASPDDSDKENWAPGTQSSIHAMRRTGATMHSSRGLLPGGNDRHAHPAPNATRQYHVIGNAENIPDTHSPPLRSPAKEGEELDCVNGLLSLSQGAWR